jgi:hypothetical protein
MLNYYKSEKVDYQDKYQYSRGGGRTKFEKS